MQLLPLPRRVMGMEGTEITTLQNRHRTAVRVMVWQCECRSQNSSSVESLTLPIRIILYAITGCVSLLFCIVIASGCVPLLLSEFAFNSRVTEPSAPFGIQNVMEPAQMTRTTAPANHARRGSDEPSSTRSQSSSLEVPRLPRQRLPVRQRN
jgi:hypothetical protein